MESDLSGKQMEQLRAQLREQRDALIEEVRSELSASDNEHFQDLAGRVHDAGEASVADLLSDLNLAIIDQHIERLRDFERALERMAMGTYGACVECGQPIGYKRLEAYPTAERCLAHQEQYEKTHAGESAPRL